MKSQHLRWLWVFIAVIVLSSVIFLGCTPISTNDLKAWIDLPFQGTVYNAGDTISLLAHVYADDGVAEVLCSVDNIPYHREAPQSPGTSFTTYSTELVINNPGEHMVSVFAYDAEGNASNPAFVVIMIAGTAGTTPTTEPPAEADTSQPPAEAPRAINIAFWSDDSQIQQGECTNLQWNVQNADSISLSESSVSSSGSLQICPSQTTTYTLSAAGVSGQDQRALTITVASPPAPQDTNPPSITNISHNPAKIWNYHTCGPDAFSVHAAVSDPSGVGSVSVRFRVKKGGQTGAWVERSMSGSGGDTYQAAIGPDDLKASLAKYYGNVEYRIVAKDGKGNSTESVVMSLEIGECLL